MWFRYHRWCAGVALQATVENITDFVWEIYYWYLRTLKSAKPYFFLNEMKMCCVSVQAGALFLDQPVLLVPKVVSAKNTRKEDSRHQRSEKSQDYRQEIEDKHCWHHTEDRRWKIKNTRHQTEDARAKDRTWWGLCSSRAQWPLTPNFPPGWLENLRFFIQIICWTP